MSIHCPLCLQSNVKNLETISCHEIVKLAAKNMQKSLLKSFAGHQTIQYIQCAECKLKFFWPQTPALEEHYKLLMKYDFYYTEFKPEYEAVLPNIPQGAKLLEVGCGNGFFGKFVSEHIGEYRALEFNTAAVAYAQKQGLNVTSHSIEEFSANHEEAFDIVCSFQVLEHVSQIHSFIKASLAALIPDGLFFFAVPNNDSYLGIMENAVLNLPPHHLSHWSNATLKLLPKLFPIETIGITEIPLEDNHSSAFFNSLYQAGRRKKQKRAFSLVRKRSFLEKVHSRLFVFPFLRTISLGLSDLPERPVGHTIIGLYRKRTCSE
jgi:2-polyprenyl-3-methyl-5-hydroxy-6-metoxy-1,4-benzoquinol methylase